MMAVWDDDFGKASGRDEGTGLAHFLLNPVNDTVDTASSAVDNAAAHAVDGIGADHLFRRIKADLWQLRGAGRQRIQGDAKPRDNHAAKKIFVAVDRRDRRGGTHVDDDERSRVIVDRSYCVSDPVASKLCRIVEHDLQTGTDPRSDDHDRFAGQTSHSCFHRMCDGRHD